MGGNGAGPGHRYQRALQDLHALRTFATQERTPVIAVMMKEKNKDDPKTSDDLQVLAALANMCLATLKKNRVEGGQRKTCGRVMGMAYVLHNKLSKGARTSDIKANDIKRCLHREGLENLLFLLDQRVAGSGMGVWDVLVL
eukprot:TRINITY_DN877_c0_g3_i1.p1 TRINITY_DN877_c0_g3~~TRINITY_DN877_c0_g3_i1.p1  ORF type:complete len:141 (-),score=28.02 TRINITY_DN877_c0_g3_i1:78-500(-)